MSAASPARKPATEPPPPPATATATATARRRAGWPATRPLVLRLHFYAGLLIAPFLLVAALTGGLYAASYQIEKVLYADELTVPVGDRTQPVSDQVAAAQDAHPDGEVSAVRPAEESGTTTRVLLDDPSVGEDRQLAVFVDPYTAEVRGSLESYGSSGALPFRAWVSELHRSLHLGEAGRLYSELAASWLWVVALGGVVLWLARRRSQRRLLGTRGRRRTRSLHGLIGLWATLGLLVLSATGLTWSTYAGENIGELRTRAGGATPVISSEAGDGHEGHEGHEGHDGGDDSGGGHEGHGAEHPDLGMDRVLEIARGEHGLSGPLEILPPVVDEEGVPSAYVVKEIDKQLPHRLDQVAVDASSGELTDRLDFADYPVLAKLSSWGISAHEGQLLGIANQLVLLALAVGLIALIVLGYRMWWLRRPTGGARFAFGRPYPPGAWRQLPVVWWLPLAAATLLVGWFVPLLGLGLLAFLAVDLVLGLVTRRRPAPTSDDREAGGAQEPEDPEEPGEAGEPAAAGGGRTP